MYFFEDFFNAHLIIISMNNLVIIKSETYLGAILVYVAKMLPIKYYRPKYQMMKYDIFLSDV